MSVGKVPTIETTRQKWAADWGVDVPALDIIGVDMFGAGGEVCLKYRFVESKVDEEIRILEAMYGAGRDHSRSD